MINTTSSLLIKSFETEISFVSFFVNECTLEVYKCPDNVSDLRFRAKTTGTPNLYQQTLKVQYPKIQSLIFL